ncbi:MAG TPA: 4Fe-4S binding protein, partial [Candidatus Latescibacteria bacterium]|nr:4Fe-4S binding protein [Candidatus Latescibacterota bacterium]
MDDDVAVVNPEECTDCGACVDECPSEAITLE